jgi:phage shock protein E
MDASVWIIVGIILFVLFTLAIRRAGMASAAQTRQLLAEGAIIVDVRSKEEFDADHLAQAINLPLSEVKTAIGKVAPDKERPVLLHCLSGGRSSMARSALKRMGYTKAYNLGSINRARRLLSLSPPDGSQ